MFFSCYGPNPPPYKPDAKKLTQWIIFNLCGSRYTNSCCSYNSNDLWLSVCQRADESGISVWPAALNPHLNHSVFSSNEWCVITFPVMQQANKSTQYPAPKHVEAYLKWKSKRWQPTVPKPRVSWNSNVTWGKYSTWQAVVPLTRSISSRLGILGSDITFKFLRGKEIFPHQFKDRD